MNPLAVRKIIKESKNNGERIIIEDLSAKCGVRLRHRFLLMSREMFECDSCGGLPRHWVKGISLYGWIALWNYKPPEVTDFSPIIKGEDLKSFSELQNISEVSILDADSSYEK